MLQINGKTFMNLQEAVQWLLDNNALPFQCSANYIANTEIGMGTIVNPSPAKVRIGSLIFFADSKVSTVTGITENGFICSDQYNDLVDDVVYVSNVQINASDHLIVTLSNGTQIDAGLIKQITGFSIDGLQHLIASYNDGTSTDLGPIFNGDVVCKTLYQTDPNWEANFSDAGKTAGLQLSNTAYTKLVQVGNIVWAIVSGFLENTGATDISNGYIGFGMIIDEDTASKIYRVDGTNCNQAYSTSEKILWTNSNLDDETIPSDVNSYSARQLVMYARGINLQAGASKVLSIRIPLIITGA